MARGGVITLDKLVGITGVTGNQLDQECDDLVLTEIAEYIVEYKRYAPWLGVDGATVKAFVHDHTISDNIKLITAEVFKDWHNRMQNEATYRALALVALKLKDGKGARKICEICQDVSSSPVPGTESQQVVTQPYEDPEEAAKIDTIAQRYKVTRQQLNRSCDDADLEYLGRSIAGYVKYAYGLGLKETDIDAIDGDVRIAYDVKQKLAAVFKLWKQKCKAQSLPGPANFLTLLKLALKLEDGDGAEEICLRCKKARVQVAKDVKEEVDSKPPKQEEKAKKASKRSVQKVESDGEEVKSNLEPQPKRSTPKLEPASTPGVRESDSEEEDVDELPPRPSKKGIQQFCTNEEDVVDQAKAGVHDKETAPGSARRHLLWDMGRYSRLKVHFLNPKVLKERGWSSGDQLTLTTIFAWATSWNTHATYYPKIVKAPAEKDEAQIRVKFDKSVTSWSKVGKGALRVTDEDQPTMVLNLYMLTVSEQESMVLHEFGHVLGLDHEHQRASGFWNVLERKDDDGDWKFIIGKKKMKNGNKGQCVKACDAHFRASFRSPGGTEESKYDSKSIMHYWFDINWLESEYHDLGFIETTDELDEDERAVLKGVHERDYHNGQLPLEPSPLDYKTLNNAYQSQAKSAASL